MGPRTPIEPEFARAAIVASASDAESFGLTLVEAMRCGVPVVSTDCPLGPAEIIRPGVNGLLVPPGDDPALAAALSELITDPRRRRAMGATAAMTAERYDPHLITQRYELLIDELSDTRGRRAVRRTQAGAARGTARLARRAASPFRDRLGPRPVRPPRERWCLLQLHGRVHGCGHTGTGHHGAVVLRECGAEGEGKRTRALSLVSVDSEVSPVGVCDPQGPTSLSMRSAWWYWAASCTGQPVSPSVC